MDRLKNFRGHTSGPARILAQGGSLRSLCSDIEQTQREANSMARQAAPSHGPLLRTPPHIHSQKTPGPWFLPSFKVRNKMLRPRQVNKEHNGVCHLQHRESWLLKTAALPAGKGRWAHRRVFKTRSKRRPWSSEGQGEMKSGSLTWTGDRERS